MGKLKDLTPLFTVTITFCAVFTALGLMFNILLSPMETRMDRMETRMDRIEDKIDQLISSQKQQAVRKPATP